MRSGARPCPPGSSGPSRPSGLGRRGELGGPGTGSKLCPAEAQSPPCGRPLGASRLCSSSSETVPQPPPPSPRPDGGGLPEPQPHPGDLASDLRVSRPTPPGPKQSPRQALSHRDQPPRERRAWRPLEGRGGRRSALEARRLCVDTSSPRLGPWSRWMGHLGRLLCPLRETSPRPDDDGHRPHRPKVSRALSTTVGRLRALGRLVFLLL